MKTKQISVFLENKPGRLSTVCNALAAAGINLVTLSLADTQQFGILRLIAEDVEKASHVLQTVGCAFKVSDVVAVEVANRPGGLAAILSAVEGAGISVEYMYAFAVKREENAVLIFRFDQMDKAIEVLQASGTTLLAPGCLFSRDA